MWQGNDGNLSRKCPRTLPKRRYFHTTSRGVENGSSKPYVFVVFWDAFWPTFRFLGQKSASGSKTLNPVRTPGCGFRCFSWKIASRNHQYSLGLTWYFERGDDGKSDSKRIKNVNVYVWFWCFFAKTRKCHRKRINKVRTRVNDFHFFLKIS